MCRPDDSLGQCPGHTKLRPTCCTHFSYSLRTSCLACRLLRQGCKYSGRRDRPLAAADRTILPRPPVGNCTHSRGHPAQLVSTSFATLNVLMLDAEFIYVLSILHLPLASFTETPRSSAHVCTHPFHLCAPEVRLGVLLDAIWTCLAHVQRAQGRLAFGVRGAFYRCGRSENLRLNGAVTPEIDLSNASSVKIQPLCC